MNRGILESLRSVRGCLTAKRTLDAAARRRFPEGQDEDDWLAPFGSSYETDFQKILCSKAVRRLEDKTQVVVLSRNSHARDRLSHSFEVINVAATAARILGLNEALCRAGALGHDIGHTPFGHAGESFLHEITGQVFRHEIFGCVIAQKIERKGHGLNLTRQTLGCIRNHSRGAGELETGTLAGEERLVMYADKIAYVFSDYNDLFARKSIERGKLRPEDFPGLQAAAEWFGANQRQRNFTCIASLCLESAEKGEVSWNDSEAAQRFAQLKKLMYGAYAAVGDQNSQAVLRLIYEMLGQVAPDVHPAIAFALMNDEDILWLADKLIHGWRLTQDDISFLSIQDVIPHLQGRKLDFTDPDLDW